MIATETAKTVVLVLFGLSILWIVVIIVRTTCRRSSAPSSSRPCWGSGSITSIRPSSRRSPSRPSRRSSSRSRPGPTPSSERDGYDPPGGRSTTYVFDDPGPPLSVAMIERRASTWPSRTSARSTSSSRYLGLPPVDAGVPELASITGPDHRHRQVPLGRLREGRPAPRAGHLPRHDLGPDLHLHRPDHGHRTARRDERDDVAAIVLAVMVAAFVVAKVLKISTELSLFAAALAGALAGGARHPGPAHRRGRLHLLRHRPHLRHRHAVHEPAQGIGGGRVRRPGHPAPLPPAQGRRSSSCWPCSCSSPAR